MMRKNPLALIASTWLLALPPAAHAAYSFQLTGTTLGVTGDAASDVLAVFAAGPNLVFDVGADGIVDSTVALSTFDTVVVTAGAGDDQVTFVGNLVGEVVTVHGEAGDDVISGSNAGETITPSPHGRTG
jgi:hypothetical protein